MQSDKVFIFDFDGTIVDSNKEIIRILNNIIQGFGFDKLSESDIDKFRNQSLKNVMKEYNLSVYRTIISFWRFRRQYSRIILKLKPIPGMSEVLSKLNDEGIKLHIVSSNSEKNITAFLKKNNLEYFDQIKGGSYFGKQKAIKKLIKSENLSLKNVIFIGDETRDIDSAKLVGVKSVAVTWGLNKKEILSKNNPDYLLSRPEELLNL